MGKYSKGDHVKIEVVNEQSGESEWMLLQSVDRPGRAIANSGVSRGSPHGNAVRSRRAEWAFEIQTEKLCPLPEHLKWQSRRDANVDPAC